MVKLIDVIETINFRNPGIRTKSQGARRGSRPRIKIWVRRKAN
jgi:hypothetical protein